MSLLTVKDLENKVFPLAKAAEESGRWEILQGVLLTVIAVADLSETELVNVVSRLNIAVINQLRASQTGSDKILESVGLSKEKLKIITAKVKEQSEASGDSNA